MRRTEAEPLATQHVQAPQVPPAPERSVSSTPLSAFAEAGADLAASTPPTAAIPEALPEPDSLEPEAPDWRNPLRAVFSLFRLELFRDFFRGLFHRRRRRG